MLKVPALLLLATIGLFSGPAQADPSGENPRLRENFDHSWFFHRGDAEGAQANGFDASAWRPLNLPHDWAIESPFDARNASGAPGGYLPVGVGWYRKTFRLPAGSAERRVFIEFDGVYMNSEVWINGHHLGLRPYGYIGFEYDLTPHLDFAGDNVLAVRVDNSLLPSARWYTGSGIYRHVWLKITDPLRVSHWGTYVTTPEITAESATVAIQTSFRNDHPGAKPVTVKQSILSADGGTLASVEETIKLAAGAQHTIPQTLTLPSPKLWSPESPNLYTIRTELLDGTRLADRYESPLGIREIRFDPAKGLFVNGESVIMQGMCNHQDLGPLGSALWDQALERRVRMLKQMGCNAIRTAHYPHSPELIALCDKLGLLVVNETFDEWRRSWAFEGDTIVSARKNAGKAKFGYHRYFDEWAERDLTDHLMRDRNHPSVIMWSIGNEVPEAQKHGEIETVRILRDICHKIDPTRPVTAGINYIRGANETGFLEVLDIVGYNGGGGSCFLYEQDHKRFPHRVIYASEVPHSLQTRGEYRTLTRFRERQHQPADLTETEVFPETDALYESSYDNAAVRINARDSWRLTRDFPFVAGEFRWTGFDYIGESGGWPRVLGNFGVIDLCNFPKDTFYFYQSQWTEKPMVHILPHWNWPGKDGTAIPVLCYTNCDDAELFLNGKSLGTRSFNEKSDMHLEWHVPYQPGELKVVARKDGKVAATSVTRTSGPPARVAIAADQVELDPARRDLSYLAIHIEDENGNFHPRAANWVTIQIEGPGRLVGITNGDPVSHTGFLDSTVRTFNGRALAILSPTTGPEPEIRPRSTRKPGEIIVRASVKGLESSELRLIRSNDGTIRTTAIIPPPRLGPVGDQDGGVPPVD